MKLVRVHIATTQGPAEIQRLTEESPGVRSVVCLDGRAVALPISRDYENFVRRPTGLVERLWGGAAFRMDVGAAITDGLSWQLGAFLAHGLRHAERLAEVGAAADTMVWATGEVDAALAVRMVEHIAVKLRLSVDLLRAHAALRPWVIVPAGAEALAQLTLAAEGLAGSCRVLGVGHAREALAAIGLAIPGEPAAAASKAPPVAVAQASAPAAPRNRRRFRTAALAACVILLALAGAAGKIGWDWNRIVMSWTDQAEAGDVLALDDRLTEMAQTPSCLSCATGVRLFRSWLAGRAPPPGAVAVEAEIVPRSAEGFCLARSAPSRVALADAPHGGTGATSSPSSCAMGYVVSGAASVALIVSSTDPTLPPDAAKLGAGEAGIRLPMRFQSIYPPTQRIVALAARAPLDTTLAWLRKQLPEARAPLPAALVSHLAALGVATRVVWHTTERGP